MAKILFIVDSYKWALYNRAINLQKRLQSHHIDILYFKELDDVKFENYDIVYSLNWPIHGYISKKIDKSNRKKYKLYTTICSHVNRPSAKSLKPILKTYDRISCSNMLLYNEFKSVYPKKTYYTPFGVDTKRFVRLTNPGDLRSKFGFVGNHTRKVKRFEVIKSTINSVKNAELSVATANTNFNRGQMVEFYNSIGTLICFSESEGTPNPVLEAASAARGIISSKVGNVNEINAENNIIIVSNKRALRAAVVNIMNGKHDPKNLGLASRRIVQENWSWDILVGNFKAFLGVR